MKLWNRKKDTIEQINDLLANVQKDLQRININSDEDARNLRAAFLQMASGTYGNDDTMHNVYTDFGYPLHLTFAQMWNMYRRFGIAKNVVDLPVSLTWLTMPEITETNNAQFEKELEILIDEKKLWHRIKGVDNRQRVGRYAGLFMRVNDGLPPDQELTETSITVDGLIDIIPLYEGQLEVITTEQDVLSVDYAKPTMYAMRSDFGSGNRDEHLTKTVNIHPSRLVIAAEGADDGNIYGIPALEACYNSLMDLRKIIGASGEGFYRAAVQSVVFELMDTAKTTINEKAFANFTKAFDDWIKNRARRAIMSPGMKPHIMSTTMPNSKDHFMCALNDVAASSQIPATVLIGQQTGRLASDEDSRSVLSMANSRRENYATELVRKVLDWLIKYGVLPYAEYTVAWDDLLALSDSEKLANAFKMADINAKQTGIGGEIIFTSDEIRESAGYDPLTDVEAEGEEIDDLDDDLDEDESNGQED